MRLFKVGIVSSTNVWFVECYHIRGYESHLHRNWHAVNFHISLSLGSWVTWVPGRVRMIERGNGYKGWEKPTRCHIPANKLGLFRLTGQYRGHVVAHKQSGLGSWRRALAWWRYWLRWHLKLAGGGCVTGGKAGRSFGVRAWRVWVTLNQLEHAAAGPNAWRTSTLPDWRKPSPKVPTRANMHPHLPHFKSVTLPDTLTVTLPPTDHTHILLHRPHPPKHLQLDIPHLNYPHHVLLRSLMHQLPPSPVTPPLIFLQSKTLPWSVLPLACNMGSRSKSLFAHWQIACNSNWQLGLFARAVDGGVSVHRTSLPR